MSSRNGVGPRVVALGGGHGLAASLRALRAVTPHLTAVVGVSDNGGSSGRIREQFDVVPPGDLRMALAALCGDDQWGSTWARVLQHRFSSTGDLDGHALGNLLITALWQETGDVVSALDWVSRLLDSRGRVLPLATDPLEVRARAVDEHGAEHVITGQAQVGTTNFDIKEITLVPSGVAACPQALTAVQNADVVVLGPGSWFTSVMPHFQVQDMASALISTQAKRVLVLNLDPAQGETRGFGPETFLQGLAYHHPDFRLDIVIADQSQTHDRGPLEAVAKAMGAEVHYAPVANVLEPQNQHDPVLLASAFEAVFASGIIGAWQ